MKDAMADGDIALVQLGANPQVSRRAGLRSGRPDSLSVHAFKTIREAIRSGRLVANRRYSENELAASMGMSRTPVREALIELAREGLLEIQPQRGFMLRTLTDEETDEIFELRGVLATFVVERLARTATPADIDELKTILHKLEAADDVYEFSSYAEEFHLAMPRMVGLWRTHEIIDGLTGAMWLMGTQALAPELATRTRKLLEECKAILRAIEAHDPEAAVAAMRKHIEMNARAVNQIRMKTAAAQAE